MSELTRRQFIQSALLALPVLNSFFISDNSANSTPPVALLKELESLHKIWTKKYEQCPSLYLAKLPEEIWSKPSVVRELIANEFRTNSIIEVNGLILSQTEVALSALYFKEFS